MNHRDPQADAVEKSVQEAQTPSELSAAGRHHRQAGQPLDAQRCAQRALSLDASHADSLHLMGLLSLDAGHYDHALQWIVRAIRQDPKPEYLSSLGTTLRHLQRYDEALAAFDKAVQLKPGDAELWKNLGTVLTDLQRPADALLSLQQALALDPDYWDAACASAVILCGLQRFDDALNFLERCDALRPNHVATLCVRASALHHLRRFEEALAVSLQAYALAPADIEALNGICEALASLDRPDEALQWFDRALQAQPDWIDALNNKAVALQRLHRFDEAAALYDRVQLIDPQNASARWNAALLHLLTGNFEAGWAAREARWQVPNLALVYPKFAGPMWLGQQSVAGKTILIGADEGLGDTIQFVRYAPMLAARGATVILAVQDPLHTLLSGLSGIARCLPASAVGTDALPGFDMHCPLSSLPLAFGTRLDTIPAAPSYLAVPAVTSPALWEHRLGPRDRLRVGLVWSGNPKHTNDHNRSIALRMLSPILDLEATFVSLQKDPRADDEALLRERNDIVDLTAHLTDFAQTAALISCLDLVITVDTSIAHLAGALGCPTWVLLPHLPDYRWLLDRNDSPWYPTMRLFRQTRPRDYAGVIDRIRAELAKTIAVAALKGH